MRYRLDLAYDGTRFSGWQVQPGRRTPQGELESAFGRLGESARPIGAGRTDAGVHALSTTAHVDLVRSWDPGDLQRALTGALPADVHILGVRRVAEAFHARYQAVSRTYHYALAFTHNAFFRERRWVLAALPGSGWARAALAGLHGEQDCASFCKTGSAPATTHCRVTETMWTSYAGGAVLSITADRFLYGMVRAVVGSLIRGCEQGEDTGVLARILDRRDRSAAGEAAPAQGLYLSSVRYPGEPPIDRRAEIAFIAGLGSLIPDNPGDADG